eukprot:541994_1
MSRFLIADASNLIFRGASVRRKDPNYLGGFHYLLRTVFKHIKHINPTHVVIAGDGQDSSATRRDKYPDYKLNRPKCPEVIKHQLINVHHICNAVHIPFITQQRHEADDIINTFVKQAIQHNFHEIHIIADDKDLFTLLDDERVQIHRCYRSEKIQIPNNEIIPLSKFMIKPKQIPDFLALVGDPVDNIPGCCCVGIKTAGRLLNMYENIDAIFDNLEDIQKKNKSLARRLKMHKESISNSLSLTKLYDLKDEMEINLDCTRFDVNLIDEQTENKLDQWDLAKLYKKFIVPAKEEISRNSQ